MASVHGLVVEVVNADDHTEPIDLEELEEFIDDAELYGITPQMELHVGGDLSDLIPREQQTRRGRRVSRELMTEVRAMLEQLTDSGRLKIAAVSLSYGTGTSELSAIWMMERIRLLRLEHGWTDPDLIRALQPGPKGSS